MKDNYDERPEKDGSGETPIFSDQDLEDYLKVEDEEEYPGGGEMPREEDPSPQTLASMRRQRRSRRSLMFVALLCAGLGILVLVFFFFMRPEVRKPQIVAKRMKRPIPTVEKGEKTTGPAAVEEAGKASTSGIPEKEKQVASEPSLIIRERGPDKKVIILGEKELPKEEREVEVPKEVSVSPLIQEKSEEKPQVAKVDEPKVRPRPEEKLPTARYTVNVASFRERVRAERLSKELEGKGYKPFIAKSVIPQKGTWYRVSVGRFPSRGEAEDLARALKEKDGLNSFVRELTGTER
jgi:cell division septation protein DedD